MKMKEKLLTSTYLSTHLSRQVLSLLLKLELGLVTHALKHLSLTVCNLQKEEKKIFREERERIRIDGMS